MSLGGNEIYKFRYELTTKEQILS